MNQDASKVHWGAETELNQPAPPRYLYKYRPAGEFTDRIIRNSELWFALPQHFNDPFDCQLSIHGKPTVEQLMEFFRIQQPEMARAERRRQVKELFKDTRQIERVVNSAASTVMSKCGIYCLAEHADDILMWAHYSSSHTGLCLKFDLLADEPTFQKILKVQYCQVYPTINLYGDLVQAVHQLMSTKAVNWEYEQEWRLINQASGAFKYNKEALVEVIFGVKATQKTVEETQQLLRAAGMQHVTLKQAKVNKNKFALDIVPLRR